ISTQTQSQNPIQTSSQTYTPTPVGLPIIDLNAIENPEKAPGGYHLGPSLLEPEPSTLTEEGGGDFHFDPLDWNEMRRAVEEGRKPGEAVVEKVAVSSKTAEAPKAPPGQIKVELPYES